MWGIIESWTSNKVIIQYYSLPSGFYYTILLHHIQVDTKRKLYDLSVTLNLYLYKTMLIGHDIVVVKSLPEFHITPNMVSQLKSINVNVNDSYVRYNSVLEPLWSTTVEYMLHRNKIGPSTNESSTRVAAKLEILPMGSRPLKLVPIEAHYHYILVQMD